MLREARARARACCDVNLMTSRCSDGRSTQLNKGIVVFMLHFVGKGPLRLSYCSLLGTKQWSLCEYSGAQHRFLKTKTQKFPSSSPLGVPVQLLSGHEWVSEFGTLPKRPIEFPAKYDFRLISAFQF